ncbi:uncharacterized protein Hap1MRO34_022041 isoform 2-T2 [Clarias gariepinus]|uniref:tripartite motif-containing protein 16-like protein isoform X2 n=1 Tax=Clarias gariepinus TaxID=13013 RepID=UPI00234C5616|nr:tripartite motif-containing protein 16-like protein isoform X2 [Clarias gariepinus]
MTPGITRFAVMRVSDIKTCFDLFMPLSLKKIIIAMTSLEGKKVHGDMWNDIDEEYLDAYIGVLLLAGVYKSSNKVTDSLWDASTGRNILWATMSLQSFRMISRVLRFNNRETREKSDKLAPIRDVWERWMQLLPLMFNPEPEVTVDVRFVPFRGKCPFRQYMPSKPGEYGIKIWAACDAKTSMICICKYAWNLQRIQEKQKKVQELKQAVNSIKLSAQTAVEDSEMIFTELISSMEKKRSEVTELIRAQEKTELSRAERLLEQLEQEIADLQRRLTELEQLSHTHDHIQFIQSLQSLSVSSGREDSPSITVNQRPPFDGVRKSLSDLKKSLEEFCQEEFIKIPRHAAAVQMILPSEPRSREDFLYYFCDLTLDPNTVNYNLILSEKNRAVKCSETKQTYSDHPERFDYFEQVLSKESVCGRCYWEVEWSSGVYISVSYKDISRKGRGYECLFGYNNQSWSLRCFSSSSSSSSLSFYHNDIKTDLRAPSSSRIEVYVDHSAGTLSFYSVSDTMKLLHRVHTTFTQPLYAGVYLSCYGSTVRFCDPE